MHLALEARRLAGLLTLALVVSSPAFAQAGADSRTLPPSGTPPNTTAADAITFSDQPSFVVSGVTDWTAVGGHGSDVTLRTSEDLARTTSSLKAAEAPSDEAETRLRADLRASPKSSAANLAVGEYYLHREQFGLALPFLMTASTLNSGDGRVAYDLALTCRGLGNRPQAKLHLQQALAKQNRAEYHLLAGLLAEDEGDAYTAVGQMHQAVELSPDEENYFAWASELLLHRAVLQAVEIFRRGVVAYPASARMKTGLGSALFAGGEYNEAAEQLCQASDLQPAAIEPYLILGKIDEAAPAPLDCISDRLARFLRLHRDTAAAPYLYAMALYRRDGITDLDQAHRLLLETVATDPKYAPAYLQLGIVAAKQKDYQAAIAFYKKAVDADKTLPEPHYRLALAYDQTHKVADAKLERDLHAELKHRQAEAVEQQRQTVKQFIVSQQTTPSANIK